MFTQAIASQMGLNIIDLQCLNLLDQEKPQTAGSLADLLGLSTGAVTRLVDRLVEAGMVERVTSPSDRRQVLIRPIEDEPGTETDRKSLDSMFVSITFAWFDLISDYSDEQLEEFLRYYRRSNELLRAEVVKIREQSEKRGR